MKIISIDLEMTGLDPDTCDVLEFGAVIDEIGDYNIDICDLPTYHCYFVQSLYQGEPYALSMHPIIFRRIANREEGYNYVNPMKFGNGFKKFLIKNGFKPEHDRVTINVAGKNFGSCDLQFLNKKTDLAKHVKISHKILDPAVLYFEKGDDSLPSLEECLERAGEDGNVAHTALEDAIDVIKLIRDKL